MRIDFCNIFKTIKSIFALTTKKCCLTLKYTVYTTEIILFFKVELYHYLMYDGNTWDPSSVLQTTMFLLQSANESWFMSTVSFNLKINK